MGHHKKKQVTNLRCWVTTISDTRTKETDTSGQFIQKSLTKNGHTILKYKIILDEPSRIENLLLDFRANKKVQVLILNGGTGISSRDVTYPTVIKFLDREMKGFGELFRYLSYEEIGAYAQLSLACAGYMGRKLIYSLPGSESAVRLAMEKLILPVLGHAVYELTKE